MEMEAPAPPHLKLEILQGPRQGEVLHFPPGTAVRIGRIATGNNLPIKDPGISSKHLSILTQSNNWVLTDLDSSNGTLFNGTNIPPNIPFILHDAATIKIGELTSIHVTLLHHDAPAAAANTRRNPTRRGRPKLDPDFVPVQPAEEEGRGRRKGLKGKVQVPSVEENTAVEGSGFVDRPKSTRVTRNSKNKRVAVAVSETSVVDLDAPIEEVKEQPKKTQVNRSSKKKGSVIEVSDSSFLEEKVVEEPKNTRRTRNLKKKESVVEVSDSSVQEEPKKTRNPKKGPSVVVNSSHEDVEENVKGKKTKGGGRRRKLKEELEEEEEAKEDKVDEVEPNPDGAVDGHGDDGREGQDCSVQKEEDLNGDGNWPDLEKLSLAEWFDFLEVHLPKQIVDATEEMIESMRQKAESLREYILQQKMNDSGKLPQ